MLQINYLKNFLCFVNFYYLQMNNLQQLMLFSESMEGVSQTTSLDTLPD